MEIKEIILTKQFEKSFLKVDEKIKNRIKKLAILFSTKSDEMLKLAKNNKGTDKNLYIYKIDEKNILLLKRNDNIIFVNVGEEKSILDFDDKIQL